MKVLIAGDFSPRGKLAREVERKNFSEIFSADINNIVGSADFSFVNFESPIAEERYKPIEKCGPNLKCTSEAVEAVKYAGFSGVTLANNHILDYGVEGLRKTVDTCVKNGLNTVGVGANLIDARKVLYCKNGGGIVAVINCCEHEFSIATENTAGANPLNPIRQYYQIQKAKERADYIIVIVHGGHEHWQLPSPRMKETYRFFIDCGADAVINHHQHCFSGYEIYNNKPIFYGLGNFCFENTSNSIDKKWNEGYLVELDFERDGISFDIYPYQQCISRPTVTLLPHNAFNDKFQELNDIICDDEKLKIYTNMYYEKSHNDIESILNPFQNHYIRALQKRGLFPKVISKGWLIQLANYIMCESHRDKVEYYFDSLFNGNK